MSYFMDQTNYKRWIHASKSLPAELAEPLSRRPSWCGIARES